MSDLYIYDFNTKRPDDCNKVTFSYDKMTNNFDVICVKHHCTPLACNKPAIEEV